MSGRFQKFQEEVNVNQQDNQQIDAVNAGVFQLKVQGPGGEIFDPDVFPGDWSQAEIHRSAWEVGKDDPNQSAVCPCCARQVGHLPLNFNCNIKDLAFLGSGMPLYFQFIKSVLVIIFLIFVTSGDYNIITNWYFGFNCVEDQNCPNDWTNKASLANKRKEEKPLQIQQIMNLVCIFVIILILQQIRAQQREIVQHCDDSNYYASDYTVMVKNVKLNQGSDETNQKQLLNLFKQKLDSDPDSLDENSKAYEKNRRRIIGKEKYKPLKRVLSVNFIYNLEGLNKIATDKNALLQNRKKLLTQLYKQYEPGSVEIEQDPQFSQNEIDIKNKDKEYEEFISKGQGQFLETAFIKFQWECDRNYFLKKEIANSLLFNEQVLLIVEPPEPSDVFWENQHITTISKVYRRILGYFITLCVIIVCATLVYFLSSFQAELNQQLKEQNAIDLAESVLTKQKDSLNSEKNKIKFISQIASIFVTVINFVLSAVITKVCLFEGYSTQTGYNISLARKSSVSQFINTAVITFLISVFVTKNIFGAGGLVNNITSIFISNAWIPIVTDIVDVGGTIKFISIWWEKRKGKKNTFSQGELNLFNEKPAFSISDRYAQILKNIYFVAFYAPIVPISLVITIVWLIMFYGVEKLNILRRRTIKYSYGEELSTEMIEMLEYILPIYCGANLYWQYEFTGQISTYAIIGLVAGVINAFLPMEQINSAVFPSQEGITITLPLCEVEDKFLTDYERENPASQEIARQKYTQRSKKREDKLKQQQQNQNKINQKDGQSIIDDQHSHVEHA